MEVVGSLTRAVSGQQRGQSLTGMGLSEVGGKELETADTVSSEYSYKIGLEEWGVHRNMGLRESFFSLPFPQVGRKYSLFVCW